MYIFLCTIWSLKGLCFSPVTLEPSPFLAETGGRLQGFFLQRNASKLVVWFQHVSNTSLTIIKIGFKVRCSTWSVGCQRAKDQSGMCWEDRSVKFNKSYICEMDWINRLVEASEKHLQEIQNQTATPWEWDLQRTSERLPAMLLLRYTLLIALRLPSSAQL